MLSFLWLVRWYSQSLKNWAEVYGGAGHSVESGKGTGNQGQLEGSGSLIVARASKIHVTVSLFQLITPQGVGPSLNFS